MQAVDAQFSDHTLSFIERTKVTVESQLLVTGVLCCFACIFQLVSMVSARNLHHYMVIEENEGDGWVGGGDGSRLTMQRLRERDALLEGLAANRFSKQNILGKLNFHNKRPAYENRVIMWSSIMGIYHIYFKGMINHYLLLVT